MTEARLFAIGLGIWIYKAALETLLQPLTAGKKRPARVFVALLHGLFWGLIGVLAGVTLHAYLGNVHGFLRVGLLGAGAGLIFGVLSGLVKAGTAKSAAELLAADLEWSQTASSAILLAAVIMYCLVQAFKIPSGSMQPTLYEGDHLFVNKFFYGVKIPFTEKRIFKLRDVRHGDVVVFRFPEEDKEAQHYGKDFIKRAIALAGDLIEIRDKEVFVNGKSMGREPYTQFMDSRIFTKTAFRDHDLDKDRYQKAWAEGELSYLLRGDEIRDNFGPIKVPEGYCFVLGDNRDASYDSRFWGPLPFSYVKGRAWFIYWPPKRAKVIR